MMAMRGRVVISGLLLVSLWPSLSMAEWGKPLGGSYDGPEGKPRVVTPLPAELGADERATMAVFEGGEIGLAPHNSALGVGKIMDQPSRGRQPERTGG